MNKSLEQMDGKLQDIIKEMTRIEHLGLIVIGNGVQHTNSYQIWHKRLGRAPLASYNIHQIQVKSNVDKVYNVCPMAKLTKLPCYFCHSKCNEICQMIHIDTWGPYRVPTHRIYRYFLTLIDYCTRTTWVYVLKCKSQALTTLQQLMSLVATQLQTNIENRRSDNPFEFHSDPCQVFFRNHGILQQSSCANIPQQNGRVERKHRHILEVARALRF